MLRRIITPLAVMALAVAGWVAPAEADIIWTQAPAVSLGAAPIRHPIGNGQSKIVADYHYQTGFKNLNGGGAVNSGAIAFRTEVSQHTRAMPTSEYHTLYEIAAITAASPGNGRNIVEIGNTTDRLVNGDAVTRLFGGIWVKGGFLCYPAANANSCGFLDNPAESVSFHTALAVTAAGVTPSVFYTYQIARGNSTVCDPNHLVNKPGWHVQQQNIGVTRVIACAPDTNWTSVGETFTKIDDAQAFTELAVGVGATPCADAGSGTFASSALPSAAMDNRLMGFTGAAAGTVADWDSLSLLPAADSPTYYTMFDGAGYATPDPDRMRLGGPGDASC